MTTQEILDNRDNLDIMWVEPLGDGADKDGNRITCCSECRAPINDCIAFMRKMAIDESPDKVMTECDLLSDFMVIHWAKAVPKIETK